MKVLRALVALAVLAALARGAGLGTEAHRYLQEQVRNSGFSGAVLIGGDGKVLFARGYGLANAEWNIPNTSRTKFRTASLGKHFTAAAIALLEQQEKLKVQDKISQYVPRLPAPWQAVTLHQLLTHTSGIPSYTDSPELPTVNRLGASPAQLLDLVRQKPMEFAPGTRSAYCNTGYILLGLAIEKASGQRFADFIEQQIFAPLEMRNTGYDAVGKVVPDRAEGYQVKDRKLQHAEFLDTSVAWSAGAFYSTVEDLFTWSEALTNGALLTKDSVEQMFRAYPETEREGRHYGYGVALAQKFNQPMWYQGGAISGFATVLQRYPEARLSVIVMANLESVPVWDVATSLAALLLDQKGQAGEAAPDKRK